MNYTYTYMYIHIHTTKYIPTNIYKYTLKELNLKEKRDSILRTDLRETIQPQKTGNSSKEIPSFLTKHGRKIGLQLV